MPARSSPSMYVAFTEPDPDGNSYQPGAVQECFVGLRVVMP